MSEEYLFLESASSEFEARFEGKLLDIYSADPDVRARSALGEYMDTKGPYLCLRLMVEFIVAPVVETLSSDFDDMVFDLLIDVDHGKDNVAEVAITAHVGDHQYVVFRDNYPRFAIEDLDPEKFENECESVYGNAYDAVTDIMDLESQRGYEDDDEDEDEDESEEEKDEETEEETKEEESTEDDESEPLTLGQILEQEATNEATIYEPEADSIDPRSEEEEDWPFLI